MDGQKTFIWAQSGRLTISLCDPDKPFDHRHCI
jgi:hypothetical protein